jgi:vancomycin resistance protein YoaR
MTEKTAGKTANKTSGLPYMILAAFLVILALGFLGTDIFAAPPEKINPGVKVMDIDLGGLNKAEGLARLNRLESSFQAAKVPLRYQGWNWILPLEDVGLDINEEAVIMGALQAGNEGSRFKRWQDRSQIEKNGLSLQPDIEFDQEKLAQLVRGLASEIIVEPVAASFKISGSDRVSVALSQNGIDPELDKLKKDITEVLYKNKQEVALSLVPAAPSLTTDDLESMKVNGLLGGYTTKFDTAKINRTYNVGVAAQALDGLLVMPGQVVSFNEVVGPRSSEAGYKIAPVIINDEFVDDLGGGVCQVSTTLFNSVLLANLEIEERYCHSLPVSYVPMGRDATVAYGSLDFKFSNNTADYLYLKTTVQGEYITIKIFGNTAYKRDVTIESQVTDEIAPGVVYENDPNLPSGTQVVKKEGSTGYRAYMERIVYLNGKEEKRDAPIYSSYNAKNTVIAVGTGETAPKIAPSQTTKPTGTTTPGGATKPTVGTINPGA